MPVVKRRDLATSKRVANRRDHNEMTDEEYDRYRENEYGLHEYPNVWVGIPAVVLVLAVMLFASVVTCLAAPFIIIGGLARDWYRKATKT